MPITLGCHACGKRFKARDESAGKRVKCPYCGAAVMVPTPEESAAAGAPTMALPSSPPPSSNESLLSATPQIPIPPPRSMPAAEAPPLRPAPAPVATPDDWGAIPVSEAPHPPAVSPSESEALPAPFPMMPKHEPLPRKGGKAITVEKTPKREKDKDAKTAEQIAAKAWRSTRGGLFCVLFGLFLLLLPGFIGFAKEVLPRAGVALPKGEGWSIPGYINSNENNTLRMSKEEQIDILSYASPVILGGLALAFGRMGCSAAPRDSGAKALFTLSGVFTFIALGALITAGVCDKLQFGVTYRQAGVGFLIAGSAAEFWFLCGLAASGVSLKRPGAGGAVCLVGFFFLLAAVVPTLGWTLYKQELRPRTLDDDWRFIEQTALMLGWILTIGVYWRAVGLVRRAIRDFLETVEE